MTGLNHSGPGHEHRVAQPFLSHTVSEGGREGWFPSMVWGHWPAISVSILLTVCDLSNGDGDLKSLKLRHIQSFPCVVNP